MRKSEEIVGLDEWMSEGRKKITLASPADSLTRSLCVSFKPGNFN